MYISGKNGHKSFFTWEWLHLHSYNPRLERYLSPQYVSKSPISEVGNHYTNQGTKIQTLGIRNYGVSAWSGIWIGNGDGERGCGMDKKDSGLPCIKRCRVSKFNLTRNSQYIYGFCYINGVPVNPDATKALIERIAHIQHTHYGIFLQYSFFLCLF